MSDITYSTHRDGKYVTVPPIDDLCLALKEKFLSQEEKIQNLQKENKYIKSEKYATTELANMEEQLKKMKQEYYNGFPITDKEKEQIIKWRREHEEKVHHINNDIERFKFYGVSGGQYTYYFTPTGLGTFGTIKCSCGAEYNFRGVS